MYVYRQLNASLADQIRTVVSEYAWGAGFLNAPDADWLDVVASFDQTRLSRHALHLDADNTTPWLDIVYAIYTLFLGRIPERDRSEGEPKPLGDLFMEVIGSDEFAERQNLLKFIRGSAFNAFPKIIFLHIPRTAGITLNNVLRSIFMHRYFSLYNFTLSPVNISNAIFSSCFSSHIPFHYFLSTTRHQFITVVRSPVDRIVSRGLYYLDECPYYSTINTLPTEHMDQVMDWLFSHGPFLDELSGDYQSRFLNNLPVYSIDRRSAPFGGLMVPYAALDELLPSLQHTFSLRAIPRLNPSQNCDAALREKMIERLSSIDFSADSLLYTGALQGWNSDTLQAAINMLTVLRIG